MKSVQIRTRKNSVFEHFSRSFLRIILEIEVLHITYLLCKSMDWFLYSRDLHHERAERIKVF